MRLPAYWICMIRFYQQVSSLRLESLEVADGSLYFWFCMKHMGMIEGMG